MPTKKIIAVDAETGEVLPHMPVYAPNKYHNAFVEGWLSMAQGEPLELLATSDLQGNDLKVFLLLLNKVNFQNWIHVNQAELARKLNMHRQDVSKSIKKLVNMGIIFEGEKIGVSKTYRLNPHFGWKGSAKNHQNVVKLDKKKKASKAPEKGD